MAKTTARERRASARAERRATRVDEPTVDEAVEAVDGDPADALRTAASAAIAAAAVGAARALARHRRGEDVEGDEDDDDKEEEATLDEPVAAGVPDEEPDLEPVQRREPERREPEPRGAVHAGDAQRMVQRAREQLSELHGADAESVSAVRRTRDGWRVGLEVVEVHRVPESTDVLATYEVELDDDGELITFERATRYYRSEADHR